MKPLFLGYSVTLSFLLLTVAPQRLERLVPEIRAVTRSAAPGAHLVSFAILALASWIAFTRVPRSVVALGLIGFAVLSEVLQVFVPGRCCDMTDVIHNFAGLAVGIGLGTLIGFRSHTHSSRIAVSPCIDPPSGAGTTS
jgi:VanZ family protein